MGKKKSIWIALFVLVLVVAGAFASLFLFPKEQEKPEMKPETKLLAEHVASYNENGMVSLYEVESGEKVDEVDLKTKTSLKEKTAQVEENVQVEQEDCKCIEDTSKTENSSKEGNLYKGYEMVTKQVKKGEHIWGIQSQLTPNINTIQLLPLLQEVNKGKSLHPIAPNETRIFLKEPDSKLETPKKKAVSTAKQVSQKTVTKKVEESTFIYMTDLKSGTLYAYSNFANEVYQLTVKEGKWEVTTLVTLETSQEAVWLHVDTNHIWLADQARSHIQVFDVTNPKQMVEWDTKGKMSKWHIEGDLLHYTYDNRMVSQELNKKEFKDVVLGDATFDFIKVKDKFYVLNSFGHKTDNSLFMKVNPKDLYVEDLIELKSNQTSILSYEEDGNVYVGKIEKTKGLDGSLLETPKVVSVDVESKYLKEQSMKWNLIFSSSMQGWNDHLYALEEKTLSIYPTGEDKPLKEFEVNAPLFSLLP